MGLSLKDYKKVKNGSGNTQKYDRKCPSEDYPEPSFVLRIVYVVPYNLSRLWGRLKTHRIGHPEKVLFFIFL